MTVLNGLGAEEIVREHGDWPIVSAVTFMSGTKHSDTHVEYILDTETWLGPYESTPFERVQEIADTIVASGLRAEALPDLRPAQWSKLVFNASVNPVAALTGLPHDPHFAAEDEPTDLGHVVHGLVDEGKAVARAAGIELHDDPWEMNVLATGRGSAHYPSMLEDVEAHRQTEIELITGSLIREAERHGVEVPLHRALYALVQRQGRIVVSSGDPSNRRAGMLEARKAVLALVAVASIAAVVVAVGAASTQQANTVVIGWAYDGTGSMAPFDGPALATAKDRVRQVNRGSGVNFRINTCNTQGNKPASAKSCAARLLGQGADIIFTTCDVDLAAPVVQESINAGKLTIAPCIGTDQMGPKRFGAKGRLAFSFGNVAQDEGSAMAEYAWRRGWRDASLATDTVIVYFRNVVQAFEARWRQLGGNIVTEETYQSAGGSPASWQNVVTRLNAREADVIVTSTAAAFGAQVPILNGLRTLGNNTPFLNSWAGDGNYWYTPNPRITNYYYVTFASAFGNDPVAAVNALARRNKAAIAKAGSTGGFVTGPAAIEGVLTAIRRAGGSTNGARLAAQMERFRNVVTLSGKVSFSKSLHTVFGRQYRVMRVQNNTPQFVGTVKAKVVPKI